MKTIIKSIMSVALAGFAFASIAAADEAKAAPVTLEGSATCSKCDLDTTKECGTVLQVKEGEKTVTYKLTGIVDKAWHKKICKNAKDVKATGTVSEKDGQKTLDVTAIEIEKKAK
jgi:hypothetical protein